MKKIVHFFVFILLICLVAVVFTSCDGNNVELKDFYLNEDNHLIAVYNDGIEKDMGLFNNQLISSINSITIDSDGYYVINGIKTNIIAKTPQMYSVNNNGHLIATYNDETTEDLGLLGESLVNGVTSVAISNDGYYIINGITTTIFATEVYDVYFETGCSIYVNPQRIKDGYLITRPTINRMGYTLIGWFNNDEEWKFNSHVVKTSITLEAKWQANNYIVKFENSKGDNPADIEVTYGKQFTLPVPDEFPGYSFMGWFYGNRKIEDSSLWGIDGDVTLTAKWQANTYTITLNPGSGSVSSTTAHVTFDEDFVLPIPTNDYGIFVGWKYENALVTNENGESLSKWNYTNDITLTVDWIIKIYTVDDLKQMSTYRKAEFKLMNDIDLNNEEWEPVGTSLTNPFRGVLDGDNHRIINLSITQYSDAVGVFGYLFGTVKNIAISGTINISTINQDMTVGMLCGIGYGAKINNVVISGSVVTGAHSSDYTVYTSGVCGYAYECSLNGVTNNSSVTAQTSCSGIIGYLANTNMNKCINNGDVLSSTSYAGGVVAICSSTNSSDTSILSEIKNAGDVSAVTYAGGIIGTTDKTLLTINMNRCTNYGDISASDTTGLYNAAGGLVGGQFYTINPVDCYNQGDISGRNAGGLLGYVSHATFTRCYSSGNITSQGSYAGGLGGWVSGDANDSVVFGTIQGSSLVGDTTGTAAGGITINMQNFYYNSTCSNHFGTHTNNTYEEDFYVNSLFWSDDVWDFSTTDYPTLKWEDSTNA